jgi:hypothetical protein
MRNARVIYLKDETILEGSSDHFVISNYNKRLKQFEKTRVNFDKKDFECFFSDSVNNYEIGEISNIVVSVFCEMENNLFFEISLLEHKVFVKEFAFETNNGIDDFGIVNFVFCWVNLIDCKILDGPLICLSFPHSFLIVTLG